MKPKLPGLSKQTGEMKFEVYPDDDYIVELESVEFIQKDNGRINVKIKTKIIGNVSRDSEALDKYGDKVLFAFISLADPDEDWYDLSINRLKNFLNAFGVEVDDDDDYNVEDAYGERAVATVRTRKYNDKLSNEVKVWKFLEDE